ncbi:MAG TPA: hypothetical protein VKY37_08335 [Brumimicrobium sp.]|nr:hypothetical protein [Brumimicrobium sp.]
MNIEKEEFLSMDLEEKLNFINPQNQTNELITLSNENNIKDYERIEELRKRIAETKREIERTTATFNKIAEHCKVEWFRPKWIERPNANHLQEIRYWLR